MEGKWTGGSVTSVCRGWGSSKHLTLESIDKIFTFGPHYVEFSSDTSVGDRIVKMTLPDDRKCVDIQFQTAFSDKSRSNGNFFIKGGKVNHANEWLEQDVPGITKIPRDCHYPDTFLSLTGYSYEPCTLTICDVDSLEIEADDSKDLWAVTISDATYGGMASQLVFEIFNEFLNCTVSQPCQERRLNTYY